MFFVFLYIALSIKTKQNFTDIIPFNRGCFQPIAHRETLEKERLKNADDMVVMETQLNDVRREHAKAVAAAKSAERHAEREKQQAANAVANIEREYSEKLARCEKQLKSVEKERNLLMVRIREDRSSVVRPQPATGECVILCVVLPTKQ